MNARENRMGFQEWTIQGNHQYWAHQTHDERYNSQRTEQHGSHENNHVMNPGTRKE